MKFFFFFALPLQAYEISICAIFQNEAPYLKEWIDYHRSIGVDHFYLYNNQSRDNYLKVLKPYIDKNVVEIIDWPNIASDLSWWYGCQSLAYADALKRSLHLTKWLCIIDTDEFIVPVYDSNLKTAISHYPKECVAIYATWATFGSSYVTLKPDESLLLNLTKRAPLNHPNNVHGKSIVQPDHVTTCVDPHFVVLKEGCEYFDGDAQKRTGGFKHKYLRINHYTYRDESFLRGEKTNRMIAWGLNPEIAYSKNDEYCLEDDYCIIRMLPPRNQPIK